MGPDALGEVGVGAGDVDRDGAGWGSDVLDGGDWFFVQIGVDELVADAQEFGGAEAPFVASADEHGVLEGEFESAVDDVEAGVGAEGDLADGCGGWLDAVEAGVGSPVVLGLPVGVGFEAGDGEGHQQVAWGE